MATRRRRWPRLPRPRFPHAAERRYMRQLRELADAASRDVIVAVLRAYERALAKRSDARRRGRRTAVREGQTRPPLSLGSGVWLAYERFVDRVTFLEGIGEEVSSTNRGAIVEQLDAVAIVNPVREEPWLGPVMDAWRGSNVELIRGLGVEARARINDVVQDAWQRGMSVADLERNLEEAAGIVGRRAELIARDQVGKLNGQLTMARQSALGIESYRWITSMDERVRQSHADLHDTVHRWDDPPAEGHPGSPVQCRCHAEPEIDDAIDALEALGETTEFDGQGRVVLREGMLDDGTAERALETLGRWAPASTMEEARAELWRRMEASAAAQQRKQGEARAGRRGRQGRPPARTGRAGGTPARQPQTELAAGATRVRTSIQVIPPSSPSGATYALHRIDGITVRFARSHSYDRAHKTGVPFDPTLHPPDEVEAAILSHARSRGALGRPSGPEDRGQRFRWRGIEVVYTIFGSGDEYHVSTYRRES